MSYKEEKIDYDELKTDIKKVFYFNILAFLVYTTVCIFLWYGYFNSSWFSSYLYSFFAIPSSIGLALLLVSLILLCIVEIQIKTKGVEFINKNRRKIRIIRLVYKIFIFVGSFLPIIGGLGYLIVFLAIILSFY